MIEAPIERPAQHYVTTYKQTLPESGATTEFIDYWLHPNTLGSKFPVVVLPGFGEAPSVIKGTVEELHAFPLVVLNLHFPDPSPEGIESTIQAAPLAVAHDINRLLGRDEETPLDIAGHSTGAGAALKAVHSARHKWRDLVLVSPLGLTNEFLGVTVMERRQELLACINRNKKRLRKSSDPHPDDMIDGLPIDTPTVDRAAFKMRLEWAVRQDGIGILDELVSLDHQKLRRYIGIIAARDDIVFPPDKIRQGLQRLSRKPGVDYKEVDGPHLSWIAPRGRRQFRQGVERLPAIAHMFGLRA